MVHQTSSVSLVGVILLLSRRSFGFINYPQSCAHAHHIPSLFQDGSSNNNDIFFDDFGNDFFGDEGSSGSSNIASLESRMSEVKGAEQAYDAKIARNWSKGNWGVKGFSIDQFSSSSSSSDTPIHVSVVAAPTSSSYANDISLPQDRALPQDHTVAIGRTDGSIFVVKLGDQFLTNFMAVPTLKMEQREGEQTDQNVDTESSGMTVRVENEWMDSDQVKNRLQDEGTADTQQPTQTLSPFVITHQFIASEQGEPINKLVYHDTTEDNSIICTAAGNSGEIRMWKMPSSSDNRNEVIIQTAQLSGVHSSPIVSLETMVIKEKHILFSASRDGAFALWNLDNNGELITSHQCSDANSGTPIPLTCADVYNPSSFDDSVNDENGNVIFLGSQNGFVMGYVVQENNGVISFNPGPNLLFRAHGTDNGKYEAITAIKAGGDGTISTSARLRGDSDATRRSVSSSILLTGGEDGNVKQWEILSQKTDSSSGIRMEHWPRLSTQRMKRRAHVFSPPHDGSVTCISQQSKVDASKFLTSGQDGSVCVWSASTGKELYRMDGFENLSSLAFLGRELLVTNGMQASVCIHDFGIDEDAAEKGYDLDW